ncbi:MAG: hypothetical protein Q9M43_07200 [Sulfurimonas sp.]|nr:hypothetical protein [Sulfurimonas sp.]
MSISMDDILEDEAYQDAELIIEFADSDEDAVYELLLNGYAKCDEEAESMIFKHFIRGGIYAPSESK